ncbi:MAG: hypothetical protein ACRDBG_25435 [Waterburya sp.]
MIDDTHSIEKVEDSDAIYLSEELYSSLIEIAKKRFGYTGQGIISDLVEEIVQAYVSEKEIK